MDTYMIRVEGGMLEGKQFQVPVTGQLPWPPPERLWIGSVEPIAADVAGAMLYRRKQFSELTAVQIVAAEHVMAGAVYRAVDPNTAEMPDDVDADPTVFVDFSREIGRAHSIIEGKTTA